MPDWTYQPVFRPLLQRLPFQTAQALVFGTMGLLGRLAVGRSVIRFMGHARPPADVQVDRCGVSFVAPAVLGSGIDLSAQAVSAISLFGFGMIEVGPVAAESNGLDSDEPVSRWSNGGLSISRTAAGVSTAELVDSLRQNSVRDNVKVICRLIVNGHEPDTPNAAVNSLATLVDGFSLSFSHVADPADVERMGATVAALPAGSGLRFVVLDPADLAEIETIRAVDALDCDGVILEMASDTNDRRGRLGDDVVARMVSHLRQVEGEWPDKVVIASGGVRQPADALRLLESGADLVMVDSGFADAGPGLPKRINSAVLAAKVQDRLAAPPVDNLPAPHRSWFWSALLGFSLFVGGLMALSLGWTRVLLPYDEEYLGMLREEICGINDRLLSFMSHDRVTLAGTMLALGSLYLALAWFGERRGMHWARVAIVASSLVGFVSFFLFLGFGYFDPFHAFIAAVLFQFITLGLRSSMSRPHTVEFDLVNSRSWRRAMVGQLLMVILGAAIVVAGVVISGFGVTEVFVAEDLAFMRTTREALVTANDRLVPLVAHDRASFGGMLMSTGVCVSLSAMWGWQRGRRWLWWTLFGSGTTAFVTTITIHWWVGYTSLLHLLPAYGGLLFLWLAMLLSRDWMFEDAQLRISDNRHD